MACSGGWDWSQYSTTETVGGLKYLSYALPPPPPTPPSSTSFLVQPEDAAAIIIACVSALTMTPGIILSVRWHAFNLYNGRYVQY